MMGLRDPVSIAAALAAPGNDTRQWVSFGTVDPDTDGARSVEFTKEYGPLVNVTLCPSAVPVRCRVAGAHAGNGEGEWHPFVAGDEVLVVIPEGDEMAGCTIVGRLNSEIDQWPQQVAGMDATQNNFGFRRMRFPYVVETSSNYLIRDATTGAFFGLKDGAVTIGEGDGGYLALSPDFLGFQTSDATTLLQLDVADQQVVAEANGTRLVLDAQNSSLYTRGTLQIGTAGNQAAGHAITLEQLLSILAGLAASIATTGSTPLTGATFGSLVIAGLTAPTGPTSILTAASASPITAFLAAIQAALSVPSNPNAGIPGVATPGLLIG